MKRLLPALALLVMCAPAYAGRNHQYIPNDAFDCFSSSGGPITCSPTFTDTALGQAFHYPIKLMPDGSNIPLAQTRFFFFPESHVPSDVKFDCTINYMTGGSGNKKYGWFCGASFLPPSTSGGVFWGNLYNTLATTFFITSTQNTAAAGYLVSATSIGSGNEAFRAFNAVTGADCTYAQCKNAPGILAITRDFSGSNNCLGNCTTDPAYFHSVDVSWDTP